MFLVFSKEKIYAYLVSAVTVLMLFCVASNMTKNDDNTVETSVTSNNELLVNSSYNEDNNKLVK